MARDKKLALRKRLGRARVGGKTVTIDHTSPDWKALKEAWVERNPKALEDWHTQVMKGDFTQKPRFIVYLPGEDWEPGGVETDRVTFIQAGLEKLEGDRRYDPMSVRAAQGKGGGIGGFRVADFFSRVVEPEVVKMRQAKEATSAAKVVAKQQAKPFDHSKVERIENTSRVTRLIESTLEEGTRKYNEKVKLAQTARTQRERNRYAKEAQQHLKNMRSTVGQHLKNEALDTDAMDAWIKDQAQKGLLHRMGGTFAHVVLPQKWAMKFHKDANILNDGRVAPSFEEVVAEELEKARSTAQATPKEERDLGRSVNEATSQAFDKSLSSWEAVEQLPGFSKGSVVLKRMMAKGITPAGLQAGRYTEQQLKEVEGLADAKIQALRDAGYNIPGSGADVSKGKKYSYRVKARSAFTRDAHRPLIFSGDRAVNGGDGLALEKVQSRFSLWLQGVQNNIQETVKRTKQTASNVMGASPARKAYQEAKQLADLRRAEELRGKVKDAKNGTLARLWVTAYQMGTSMFFVLGVMATLAVLFFPWGFAHFLGWFMYGVLTFAFNSAYVLVLNFVGGGAQLILGLLNAVGSILFAGLQRGLDYVAVGLGGNNPNAVAYYGGMLTLQLPFALQDVTLYNTQLLDPRFFFPQKFSANSFGSVLFDFIGAGLGSLAGMGVSARTAVGASCSAEGNAWYVCSLPWFWQGLWNTLMSMVEWVGTTVATGFTNVADLVRVGNERFLNAPLFENIKEAFIKPEATASAGGD